MNQKIQTWLGAVILIIFAATALAFVQIIDSRNPWPEAPNPVIPRRLKEKPVACTLEVMLCPDGKTSVGRTGPKCEFEPCPGKDQSVSAE